MYDLLVKLFLLAALSEIGMSVADFSNCHSGKGLSRLEKVSRDFTRIDWKTISVFPEEAKRFR